MNNFRITLHMHQLILDHRSISRLYITSKISTIEDLIAHISKTFEINTDFYLTSNNVFIPSSEDVRVLKEDDVVAAIPCISTVLPNINDDCNSKINLKRKNAETEVVELPKKKKKRKSIPDLNFSDNQKTTEENVIISVRKKSKNAYREGDPIKTIEEKKLQNNIKLSFDLSDKSQNNEPHTLIQSKNKPIPLMPISTIPKIVKSITVKKPTPFEPYFSNFNLESAKTETVRDAQEIATKSLNETEEHQLSCPYKDELLPELQTTPKVLINRTFNSFNQSLLIPSSLLKRGLSENDTIRSTQSEPSSVAADETRTEASEVESNGEKRKRKRVRKRKSKNNQVYEILEPPVFKPPVVRESSSRIHLKFGSGDEDHEEGKINEVELNDQVTQKETDDLNEEKFVLAVEGSILTNGRNEDVDECLDVVNSTKDVLCNEKILQYPVMVGKLPKEGDVIACKICVLSSSYTPEISDFIVMKVLNYCSATNKVFVKFLEGGEQCLLPEGKFFMEGANQEMDETSFSWDELIEPRLLFP